MKKIPTIDIDSPERELVDKIIKVLMDFRIEKNPDIRAFSYAVDIVKLFDEYLDNHIKSETAKL